MLGNGVGAGASKAPSSALEPAGRPPIRLPEVEAPLPPQDTLRQCLAPPCSPQGHTEKIYSVKFHPLASDILASSSYDMSLRIWNLRSGQQELKLDGHRDQVGRKAAPPRPPAWLSLFPPPLPSGEEVAGALAGRGRRPRGSHWLSCLLCGPG